MSEWISVDDELPTQGQWVDAWSFGERYTDCEYWMDKFWLGGYCERPQYLVDNVTHWMPIPRPPKSDKMCKLCHWVSCRALPPLKCENEDSPLYGKSVGEDEWCDQYQRDPSAVMEDGDGQEV